MSLIWDTRHKGYVPQWVERFAETSARSVKDAVSIRLNQRVEGYPRQLRTRPRSKWMKPFDGYQPTPPPPNHTPNLAI